MNSSTNGADRRSAPLRRARTSLLAGTAVAAMTISLAPGANAAIPVSVNLDPTYTAGTLAGLLNSVGNALPGKTLGGLYHTGPPQYLGTNIWLPYGLTIPYEGLNIPFTLNLDITAGLYLKNLKHPTTKSLYNTLAAIPQQNTGCGGYTLGGEKNDKVVASNPATTCRFAVMVGTSGATRMLANAYSTQLVSVEDPANTPTGYIAYQAAPGSTDTAPTQTEQLLAFVQNPLRPNGGMLSRFPALSKLIGQDPNMPAAGLYTSTDGRVTINTSTLDAAWAYDPTADFPVTFNVMAILNSISAALPLNLAGGLSTTQPIVVANASGGVAGVQDIGFGLASLFQVPISPVPVPNIGDYGKLSTYHLPMGPGQAYYATIVPNQLPIYSVFRLPALGINAALSRLGGGFRVGTPIIDALEPATKIMVNTGYDDVLAPDELNTIDPNSATRQTYAEEGYQAYDRTFLKAAEITPFGSVDPLTKEERKQVPKDVMAALRTGFKEMFAKPAFGFVVPATSSKAAAAKPAARVAAPAVAATAGPAGKHRGSR